MALSKSTRSLLSTLVLALLGTAAIYFGVIRTKQQADQHDHDLDAQEKVFTFGKTDVKRVSLTSKGTTIVMVKDGDGWRITSPIATRADKSSVDAIVDKLFDLKAKNIKEKVPDAAPAYVVAEGADKLKAFGLETPKFVVKLGLNNGQELTLNVGDESSYDQSIFFTRGADNRVSVANGGLRAPLDKGLFDLRDKQVVTQEDKDVQAITASGNGIAWSVERDADGWKMTLPVQDKADKSVVDGVLAKLRSVRAKSFPSEDSTADSVKYGFDKPVAELILSIGADKAKKTLQVSSVEDGGVKKGYARLVEGGPIAEVDATLGTELLKTAADMRDKTLTAFDREKLGKIEVSSAGGEKITLLRTKEKGADGGENVHLALAGHSEPLRNEKITTAFNTLSSLKALAIADETGANTAKYGLDKPQFTLVGFDAAGQEAVKLAVGLVTGSRYYVQKSGSPRVYEVEKATLDQLPRTAEDVIAPPPSPPPAPPVNAGK